MSSPPSLLTDYRSFRAQPPESSQPPNQLTTWSLSSFNFTGSWYNITFKTRNLLLTTKSHWPLRSSLWLHFLLLDHSQTSDHPHLMPSTMGTQDYSCWAPKLSSRNSKPTCSNLVSIHFFHVCLHKFYSLSVCLCVCLCVFVSINSRFYSIVLHTFVFHYTQFSWIQPVCISPFQCVLHFSTVWFKNMW